MSDIKLRGEVHVPADKSITHRAILFNSIAEGNATVHAKTLGRDNLASARVMQQLGADIKLSLPQAIADMAVEDGLKNVEVRAEDNCLLEISSKGRAVFNKPDDVLYCGNSGTTSRLMCGILAGCDFSSTLDGDVSLRSRPFARVSKPLGEMGATFSADKLPIEINASGQVGLKGISYASPVASAQVKSAILLAGLEADAEVEVIEPRKSRDHTELMLSAMGAEVVSNETADGKWQVRLQPITSALKAVNVDIPGDPSQAAFFTVAATIIPGSEILICNVCYNPTRTGLYDVLKRMGANIVEENERVQAGERVVDLRVKSAQLKATKVSPAEVTAAIDEVPILAVAAAVAEGRTEIAEIAELRVKESDRVKMVEDLLATYGLNASSDENNMYVDGLGGQSPAAAQLELADVWQNCHDHRILMCAAVIQLCLGQAIDIADISVVETSFPQFVECFQSIISS